MGFIIKWKEIKVLSPLLVDIFYFVKFKTQLQLYMINDTFSFGFFIIDKNVLIGILMKFKLISYFGWLSIYHYVLICLCLVNVFMHSMDCQNLYKNNFSIGCFVLLMIKYVYYPYLINTKTIRFYNFLFNSTLFLPFNWGIIGIMGSLYNWIHA